MHTSHMKNESIMIELTGVTKSFDMPQGRFDALKNLNLSVEKGEFLAVTGKSGSGKSTLLNMITGIDKPTSGSVEIGGTRTDRLDENELALWRGKNVGIVFQFFHLIPTLTVSENVMLPMDFCNSVERRKRRSRALEWLDRMGIADQADKFPAMLSGGQQQRASIARALANDPPVLIADEPTGNLDSENANTIFTLLSGLNESGKTIVVVTHETEFIPYFKKAVNMSDGVLMTKHEKEVRHVA